MTAKEIKREVLKQLAQLVDEEKRIDIDNRNDLGLNKIKLICESIAVLIETLFGNVRTSDEKIELLKYDDEEPDPERLTPDDINVAVDTMEVKSEETPDA